MQSLSDMCCCVPPCAVDVALSLCGLSTRDMLVIAIKSWMLHTPHHVHVRFHVITDEARTVAPWLRAVMERWPMPASVKFYSVNELLPADFHSFLPIFKP